MASPASLPNSSAQRVDTAYDTAGVAHYPLAIDDIDVTYDANAARRGVATHKPGDTVDATTGIVVAGAVNTGGDAVANLGPATLGGTGHKDVASGGTAIALHASLAVRSVAIKADASNAGTIYLGISSVTNDNTDATGGLQLEPGEGFVLENVNLSAVYINGATGDGVSFLWTVTA